MAHWMFVNNENGYHVLFAPFSFNNLPVITELWQAGSQRFRSGKKCRFPFKWLPTRSEIYVSSSHKYIHLHYTLLFKKQTVLLVLPDSFLWNDGDPVCFHSCVLWSSVLYFTVGIGEHSSSLYIVDLILYTSFIKIFYGNQRRLVAARAPHLGFRIRS